jgi:hypothetical protein
MIITLNVAGLCCANGCSIPPKLTVAPGVAVWLCLQVGMPGEWGLSVEQRKRLTIAVELVANPSVVFMDEPTSGLDARAAAIVMRAVRNTVDTGRTVVCTIHQPSIDIVDVSETPFLSGVATQYLDPCFGHGLPPWAERAVSQNQNLLKMIYYIIMNAV